jgi:hypothetical protein
MGVQKQNGFNFDLFSAVPKMVLNFSVMYHVLQVTGDDTWILFVNDEAKEQLMQCVHTHSPIKLKTFRQALSVYQRADGD